MANLENLNFEVILKDDTFKKQIAQVQAMADKFNISMSAALSLSGVKGGAANVKEVVKALNEATAAQKNLNAAIKASPAEKITIRHRDAVAATNQKMFDTARLLRTIGTLTGGAFSIYGIRRFLSSLIDITGQFEVQKMALRTMLQDIDAADKIFQDLYRFSSDSTYRFSELAKYSKQLAAFNIGKDNLLETTKMLGDVASGVGVSMDRLILAYGHVKSSGFLRGIQLRSFSQNGVPILDELAKMFTEIEGKAVSLGEVFDKMTRREIPFEMVEEAFRRMTSEGGKFYQMQEVLSKTLAGQMNILKGRWENLMYAVGQSQEGLLKGAVGRISNLIADYERFGKTVRDLAISFGTYKATQLVILAITDKMAFANLRLVKTFRSLSLTNPYMLLAAAIGAAAYAIYKQQTALSDVEKLQKSVNKSIDDFNKATNTEIGELDALYAKLKLAQEGTEGYASAKKAIETRFGTYINQLKDEGIAIDNLAVIYDNLADKIRNANKERFLESSMSDLGKVWSDVQNDINREFDKIVKGIEKDLNRSLTEIEKLALNQSITGSIAEGKESLVANTIGAMYAELEQKNGKKAGAQGRRNSGVYGQAQVISKEEVSSYADRLQALTKRYSDGMTQYADSVTELNDAFETLNRSVTATKKDGEDLLYDVNSIVAGIKNLDTEISALRNKAKGGSITQDEKDRLDALVKEREEAAKEYKDIMGVDYDKDTRASAKAVESANKEELRSLQKRVSVIQKYKEVYDTLRPFLGEENMASALGNIFGVKFEDTDFDTELDRLIVKLSELGEEGEQAAESIRASLGKDTASQLKKSLEAQDKAAEMLRDYLEKDFGVEGTGVAAQISKLLVDLTNKNLKADDGLEKFIQSLDKAEVAKKLEYIADNFNGAAPDAEAQKVRERYADEYWQKWRKAQIDAYKEQLKLEKQANEKLTNEQIVGKADDIFKMLTQTEGIDLTNWNDKTISQLRQIRAELLSLEIPQEILDMLDPETQALLQKAFDAIRGGEITKSDKVVSEKNVKAAQKLLNAFQGIGAAITEMGDAMGNDVLSGVGQILSMAEEITSVLAENESLMKSISGVADDVEEGTSDLAKSADWITMVVKLVLIAIRGITSGLVENYEYQQRVNEAATSYRDTLREIARMANDGYFGNDDFGELATNWKLAADAAERYQEVLAKDTGTSKFNTFWGGKDIYGNFKDLASKFPEIFDSAGNLNMEYIKSMKDMFMSGAGVFSGWWSLSDDFKLLLDELITAYDEMKDQTAQLASSLESIFGSLADTIADSFVDSFIETGDALSDLDESFENFGESVAKMMLKSVLSSKMMETFKGRIDALAEGYAAALGSSGRESADLQFAEQLGAVAMDMKEFAGGLGGFANSFLTAMQEAGLLPSGGGSDTLANGIKGITEDTANLLASYLNAIRADVSFLRAMAQQGWANVESITASLAVLPSLADYMVRIEAHNANTAENTQQILSELRGVISSSSGRRAFAVEVQ